MSLKRRQKPHPEAAPRNNENPHEIAYCSDMIFSFKFNQIYPRRTPKNCIFRIKGTGRRRKEGRDKMKFRKASGNNISHREGEIRRVSTFQIRLQVVKLELYKTQRHKDANLYHTAELDNRLPKPEFWGAVSSYFPVSYDCLEQFTVPKCTVPSQSKINTTAVASAS